MQERILTQDHLRLFSEYLQSEEKSPATREKYLRDVRRFMQDTGQTCVTRELVAWWKNDLVRRQYAVRSINSMLASLNSLLHLLGWEDCKVKNIRLQQQIFCTEDRELSKMEYLRLLKAAEQNEQVYLLMQTVCSTGIRISELQYFTVEALHQGWITVHCKNKTRTILVPGVLRKMLTDYSYQRNITAGPIFINSKGKPLDRSSIWRSMKKLCEVAGVMTTKVFPHNLRKLFARSFYELDKDVAKLADILGHSSINTTRIYIMSSGSEHRRKLESLDLLRTRRNVTESALCNKYTGLYYEYITSQMELYISTCQKSREYHGNYNIFPVLTSI